MIFCFIFENARFFSLLSILMQIFLFIIHVCIRRLNNVIYNRTFISIIITFIKISKNIKIKENVKASVKIISKNTNNENKNDFNNNNYNFSFIDNILNIYQQRNS